MYVSVSSSSPNVTTVIVAECASAKTIVYGFSPPLIVRPQGSQVERVSETLEFTVADEEVSDNRQDVSLPAGMPSVVHGYL